MPRKSRNTDSASTQVEMAEAAIALDAQIEQVFGGESSLEELVMGVFDRAKSPEDFQRILGLVMRQVQAELGNQDSADLAEEPETYCCHKPDEACTRWDPKEDSPAPGEVHVEGTFEEGVAKSVDELVEEYRKWVSGEKDAHDQVVDEYKAKVIREMLSIAKLRDVVAKFPNGLLHLGMSAEQIATANDAIAAQEAAEVAEVAEDNCCEEGFVLDEDFFTPVRGPAQDDPMGLGQQGSTSDLEGIWAAGGPQEEEATGTRPVRYRTVQVGGPSSMTVRTPANDYKVFAKFDSILAERLVEQNRVGVYHIMRDLSLQGMANQQQFLITLSKTVETIEKFGKAGKIEAVFIEQGPVMIRMRGPAVLLDLLAKLPESFLQVGAGPQALGTVLAGPDQEVLVSTVKDYELKKGGSLS